MNGTDQQSKVIEAAEAALEAGDLAKVKELMVPHFNADILPRGAWVVARALTLEGEPDQALALYKHAYAHDPSLPFMDIRLGDVQLRVRDVMGSKSIITFTEELYQDIYALQHLALKTGDVFIDVGANVGFVSMYVAKRYPEARIIAFEPAPETFRVLQNNLAENGIDNVTALNRAVNADGRPLELLIMPGDSGASNAFASDAVVARFKRDMGGTVVSVEATTLERVFADYAIARCAVLKLDCEGAEYEILRQTNVLERIDRVVMELHINPDELRHQTPEEVKRAFVQEITDRVRQPPAITIASMVTVQQE
ncbi:MAG: FkbM family methyltransferase [Rhodospirillales bacterium]